LGECGAVGALPDGTLVMVSGDSYGTVRVWRLAHGALPLPPLELPEQVRYIVVHGDVIVVATGIDIAVHQPGPPRLLRV
jgi:hypothetical protein